MGGERGTTHVHDLPEPVLSQVLALVTDVRSATRWPWCAASGAPSSASPAPPSPSAATSATPYSSPPASPPSPTSTSPSSPPGATIPSPTYPLPPDSTAIPMPIIITTTATTTYSPPSSKLLVAQQFGQRFGEAFPNVTSLTVYARDPSVLQVLAPQWPGLHHAKLVRWHRSPYHPMGSDLAPLLAACPSLASLDLSHF